MITLTDQFTQLVQTKNAIQNAIIMKGGSVPESTSFKGLANRILEIPQEGGGTTSPPIDEWVRPSDRPALPFTDAENGNDLPDNTIYMLFGVMPTGMNDMAFQITVYNGYYVDWGDGTVDTIAANAKCEHIYDYNSLNVDPNNIGIKWVWIKFYQLVETSVFRTFIHANVRHSNRPVGTTTNRFVPSVYEIYMKASQANMWSWGSSSTTTATTGNTNVVAAYTQFSLLDRFYWYGNNLIAGGTTGFLCDCANLKDLKLDVSSFKSFFGFMSRCSVFNQPLDLTSATQVTNANAFMTDCSAFNSKLDINLSDCSLFNSFMTSCSAFNQDTSHLDFSKAGGSLSYFLRGSRISKINIDTKNATYINYMLFSAYSTLPITLDLTSNLETSISRANMYLTTSFRLQNMTDKITSILIPYSSLGTEDLVLLFGDLYDRSLTTAGTITITGVAGVSQLTTAQVDIARNKNWTIIGISGI